MDTFKVLSAFYIKEKDALLVSVEGRDARFKRGARIRGGAAVHQLSGAGLCGYREADTV